MSQSSEAKPLNIVINQPDPLDRLNTYLAYIQTNHSGIDPEVTYKASGKELLEMIKSAMLHAHSNGRARERQLNLAASARH